MRDLIFPVEHHGDTGLQTQLRRHLVDAILDGRLSADAPLPSCRSSSKAGSAQKLAAAVPVSWST